MYFFPPTHASSVLEFNYGFSFCRFYCSQVDYIKNKIHSDHFPIELKSKETPSILIQLENGPNELYFPSIFNSELENGPNEFYFILISSSDPNLLRKKKR